MESVVTFIQVVLAIAFTAGGIAKLALPYERFSNIPAVAWSKEFKPSHLRLLGVLEVCGGLGMIVPLFFPSLAVLTPLAAVGVALYMAGAMATHLRRSEYLLIAGNLLVFLVPALFVAYNTLVAVAV